jgi:hypothetical protein
MDNIEIVAWWGAIISTFVLLWDILKWLQSGPRIKSRISLNIHYDDGKVTSKEKNEYGEVTHHEEYCHIELVNIGTMPTTIMEISATNKKNGSYGVAQPAFTTHFGKKLPHVISPGEVWSCRLPMHYYNSISKHGIPEIHISLSHLSRPMKLSDIKGRRETH